MKCVSQYRHANATSYVFESDVRMEVHKGGTCLMSPHVILISLWITVEATVNTDISGCLGA